MLMVKSLGIERQIADEVRRNTGALSITLLCRRGEGNILYSYEMTFPGITPPNRNRLGRNFTGGHMVT